ncbi:MAG: hypothetical protein WAN87_03765 [Thermoplasmata archaeon]
MALGSTRVRYRTTRYRKLIRAPLPFVYRWCTDYRNDDDRLTNSIYQYRSRIVLSERARVIRIITVPGRNRNRSTDVEIITLQPPNRWHLDKFSVSDDEKGDYRLISKRPQLTVLEMRFRTAWKVTRLPDLRRYKALFNRVWDKYVDLIEKEFGRSMSYSPHRRDTLPSLAKP